MRLIGSWYAAWLLGSLQAVAAVDKEVSQVISSFSELLSYELLVCLALLF
jgi:hypothetical protein